MINRACAISLFAASVLAAAEDASLHRIYSRHFSIGAAIPVSVSIQEKALLAKQFSCITPENCMKPGSLQPSEGRFTWDAADKTVALAKEIGVQVIGHTLVWHEQTPKWFFQDGQKDVARDVALDRLRKHISTVISRYSGKIRGWDVVNEAIDDKEGFLRNTPWKRAIGDDYIVEAFKAARAADPKVELYYNDYSIESGGKRDRALRLLSQLSSAGVHLNGIGIQGHWMLDKIPFSEIEKAIESFSKFGVPVMITELDIDVVQREVSTADVSAKDKTKGDPYANGLPADVQLRLAQQYAKLFKLFLKHSDKISRVTFWGIHDGGSWLNYWPRTRTNHPLLWDRNIVPKPAFESIVGLVDATERR